MAPQLLISTAVARRGGGLGLWEKTKGKKNKGDLGGIYTWEGMEGVVGFLFFDVFRRYCWTFSSPGARKKWLQNAKRLATPLVGPSKVKMVQIPWPPGTTSVPCQKKVIWIFGSFLQFFQVYPFLDLG